MKQFQGNTAHSSGFYWARNGPCVYVGGWLAYNSAGSLVYNSGRFTRTTTGPGGFLQFNDTKLFLCNLGFFHWGLNPHVIGLEVHDSILGASVFGQSLLYNVLMNIQSTNPLSFVPPGLGIYPAGWITYDTINQAVILIQLNYYFIFSVRIKTILQYIHVYILCFSDISQCDLPECPQNQ
jgi:hypothetical protein